LLGDAVSQLRGLGVGEAGANTLGPLFAQRAIRLRRRADWTTVIRGPQPRDRV